MAPELDERLFSEEPLGHSFWALVCVGRFGFITAIGDERAEVDRRKKNLIWLKYTVITNVNVTDDVD